MHVNLLAASQAQHSQPSALEKTELTEGQKERSLGHFEQAERIFNQAAALAHQNADTSSEAAALLGAAGCRILLFKYRKALETAEAAYSLASSINDNTLAARAAGNLATIYLQLGDFRSASRNAQKAVDLLSSSPQNDYLARALLILGEIQQQQQKFNSASSLFRRAISVAETANLSDTEAMAWGMLGGSLLDAGRLSEAENAITDAYRLELMNHESDRLAITRTDLAELRYKQGRYQEAFSLIQTSLASHSTSLSSVRPYWPIELKGKILLAMGRQSEALVSLRDAVDSANKWRENALPADATNTRTVAYLQQVYQDYASLAAQLAIERHAPKLAREALEVLMQNRATSLAEQMRLSLSRSGSLPPEYFEILSELGAAQARVTLGQREEDRAKLEQLQFRLTELENKFGLNSRNFPDTERTLHRKTLRDIQLKLDNSEVLLSFCLGPEKSFLWTVTGERVSLYQLPPEAEIAKQAKAFSAAVRNSSDFGAPGRALSNELFGKLDQTARQKRNWLIVADGALLDGVPFSVLPLPADPKNETLAARHSLRFLPSESLLDFPQTNTAQKIFLGIADPIYNLADSRRLQNHFVRAANTNIPISLARLVGSGQEIRSAAKASGLPETELLVGSRASIAGLRSALENKPEIVHFAVHVVSPEGRPEEAALALTLSNDEMPELLTSEAVATLRIPGSLVVLSGCSTQQGENLPGAGLIGLGRAWLLAGASAVLVSSWPTPDDSGRFFNSFYSHFQTITTATGSLAQRAADALRLAQLDMQSKGEYRKSASFWAAYSIISKE